MIKDIKPGDIVVVESGQRSGWSGYYSIYTIHKVVKVTPKRKDVILENGAVLKMSFDGYYDCEEGTSENIAKAEDSIMKDNYAQRLSTSLFYIQGCNTAEIFKSLTTAQIIDILKAIKPLEESRMKKS